METNNALSKIGPQLDEMINTDKSSDFYENFPSSPKSPRQNPVMNQNINADLESRSIFSEPLFTKDQVGTSGPPIRLGLSLKKSVDTSSGHDQLICCDFSSDGKMLACIDEKNNTVVFWKKKAKGLVNTPRKPKSTKNPADLLIKDVRFAPDSYRLAAYSADQKIQLWDAKNPTNTKLAKFPTQHPVFSMDFNPRREDELCYSISNEIRMLNLMRNSSERLVEGDALQVRFQPGDANYMAALMRDEIMIIDVKLKTPVFSFNMGHEKEVHTICWDRSGKYIASVSEDQARVWSIESRGKLLHEIHSGGNKTFECCTFHPQNDETFVIGSYQTLEVWNPNVSNNTESVDAHNGIVRAVCTSSKAGLIASTNDDNCLKIWK